MSLLLSRRFWAPDSFHFVFTIILWYGQVNRIPIWPMRKLQSGFRGRGISVVQLNMVMDAVTPATLQMIHPHPFQHLCTTQPPPLPLLCPSSLHLGLLEGRPLGFWSYFLLWAEPGVPEVSQSPLNSPWLMPAWCRSGEAHFPVSSRHDSELRLHFHGTRLRLDLRSTSNPWLPPLFCPVNHTFTRFSWSISLIHHLPEHKQTNKSLFWGLLLGNSA